MHKSSYAWLVSIRTSRFGRWLNAHPIPSDPSSSFTCSFHDDDDQLIPSTAGLDIASLVPIAAKMSSKYAFTKTLREVRFLFCQTSEQSAAVRYVRSSSCDDHRCVYAITDMAHWTPKLHRELVSDLMCCCCRSFLTRAYPTMKKNNPNTPIMLREAAGTVPKIFARYEFGQEKSQSLEGR